MKKTLLSLVAIFAVAAHAAAPPPVVIASLPFTITAPGTYVLAGNLSYSGTFFTAIDMGETGPISGPVIIDFKGFTITGVFSTPGVETNPDCISIQAGPGQPTVTIQNGTISGFGFGIFHNGLPTGSGVIIRNMRFVQNGRAIYLAQTARSTISNCAIEGFASSPPFTTGIFDYQDAGGNTFDNITFLHTYTTFLAAGFVLGPSLSLANCQLYPSGISK